MQFESLPEFLQMGGHAAFIFSVYLISAVVVLFNVILPLKQKRQFYLEQAARVGRGSPVEEANSE